MGIMVYSLQWVLQDFVHQQYCDIVNPRKLEHGFRMISAGIPYTLPLRP